jgi:seryl-tRNA synthetase
MNISLYELSETYEKLMNLDLDDEALKLALSSLNQSVEEKATNIAHVTRTMDAGINAIKNEEKRLRDKRKALENRLDKLKEYLFDNMKAMGIDKVKTDTDTIYISGRDYSKVVDRDKLPKEYVKQKITVSIDKRKLNKDIKTKDIPGVETERKEWVVIR